MPVSGKLAQRVSKAAFYQPLTALDLDNRLNGAVIASVIVHMALIFSITFKAANPALLQNFDSIDVTLVNARSDSKPLDPDVLAQHSLDGGGNVDEERKASSPLQASDRDTPPSAEDLQSQIRALEAKAKELIAQAKSDYTVEKERSDAQEQPRQVPPAPNNLAESSLEQARLMASINENYDAYQKRPRRAFVGARAQEYSFARYVEDWRIKVERIGNLNYPEAAKRESIHGSLVLTVSINADGSLEDVQIDKKSGSRVLDAAAIKIVQMSAPYPPFSEEMRKKVDVLSITRAWQFTSSDQLQSQ
jgi:protein TonB